MKKPTQTPEHRGTRPAGREDYAPPSLKVFGPVGTLTQSGSVSVAEANGMMNIMKMG